MLSNEHFIIYKISLLEKNSIGCMGVHFGHQREKGYLKKYH